MEEVGKEEKGKEEKGETVGKEGKKTGPILKEQEEFKMALTLRQPVFLSK